MNKNPIKIIAVIICLFAITGCSSKPPSLEDRIAGGATTVQTLKSYTGTIESFGVDIYKDGTHRIRTEKGDLIIIQSSTINLNNYINKKVIIEGAMQKLIDNKSEVFTVSKITLVDGSLDGESTEYKNQKLEFQLKYPNSWSISEETAKLTFKSNGITWVTIDFLDNSKSDLDTFVKEKEGSVGTAITISSQRSLRYTDTNAIKIYIPDISNKKVYKITFNDKDDDKGEQKKLFYTFLESFVLNTGILTTGDKCGGKNNISCSDGYVCELKSNENEAEGFCVSVNGSKSNSDCPYISAPSNCSNYKAKNVNKDGCPISYECLDTAGSTTSDSAKNILQNSVDTVFIKYQKTILPSGAKLLQLEVVEKQNLLAAIYSLSNVKYKILYEYSPSANEYNFVKKAYFKEVGTAWSLQSGTDIKITSGKKVIDPIKINTTSSAVADTTTGAVTTNKDMSLYSNTSQKFSIQYPGDWYFKSFGAIGNTIWYVGFAEKTLDTISDTAISLSVLKGEGSDKKESKSGTYSVEISKDKASHFLLKGPLGNKDVIDKMVLTLKTG